NQRTARESAKTSRLVGQRLPRDCRGFESGTRLEDGCGSLVVAATEITQLADVLGAVRHQIGPHAPPEEGEEEWRSDATGSPRSSRDKGQIEGFAADGLWSGQASRWPLHSVSARLPKRRSTRSQSPPSPTQATATARPTAARCARRSPKPTTETVC